MKIVFYNPCQNGDVHVSRTYIQDFVNKVWNYEIYYAYKQSITKSNFLLDDIIGLRKEVMSDEEIYEIRENGLFESNSIVYINTWYCQKEGEYFRRSGTTNCNFYALYEIFKDVYAHFSISIADFKYYLPKVNYHNVEIDKTLLDLGQNYKKTVLLCSNDVASGQAPNFSFDMISFKLAATHKDVLFFTTENVSASCQNLINIKKLNLNQISYISSVSDIIVGRGSGPYTYSLTYDNLLNPDKTLVCFSHDKLIATGLRDEDYLCKLSWSNNFEENSVYQTIANEINEKLDSSI